MNYFSDEQANALKTHIKNIMETNQFNFVMYFLKKSEISKNPVCNISEYNCNPYRRFFLNFVRFNTFEQVDNYVNTYFKSFTDFCNKFFIINDPETDVDNNVFVKSVEYIKSIFPRETADTNLGNLENTLKAIMTNKDQYIILFNFSYKDYDSNTYDLIKEINADKDNPNCIMFFDKTLSDTEKEYFKNQYKYHNIIGNSSYSSYRTQTERSLSTALFNYRYEMINFDDVYTLIKNYEGCIKNYLITKLEEYHILQYGKNNLFINSLNTCINNIVKHFTSKKIQFEKYENDALARIIYSNESIRHNDTILNICKKVFPEKTTSMFSLGFKCEVNLYFKESISMQVKKTFLHNLHNYFINNNIKPITYNLIDAGKSKPADGFKMLFYCNDFESIGVNPIKFMIPKLGMKKLG